MHVNSKELEAVHAAIDFIVNAADGADDDKYPHDIIDGLNSLFIKAKKDNEVKHYKYLVKKALAKLRSNGS